MLQVVNAIKTGAVNITSTTYADSGLTANITPASNSKVLVFVNQLGCNTEAGTVGAMTLNLVRGSTIISNPITGGLGWNDRNTWSQNNVSFVYLDSPSGNGSTAFTYKTQAKLNNANDNGYLQNSNADVATSSIVLMEIGA